MVNKILSFILTYFLDKDDAFGEVKSPSQGNIDKQITLSEETSRQGKLVTTYLEFHHYKGFKKFKHNILGYYFAPLVRLRM